VLVVPALFVFVERYIARSGNTEGDSSVGALEDRGDQ